jgi:hypothetical protein
VEQADALCRHKLTYRSKELVKVALANVLEHANRNDAIISTGLLAIVEQLERYLVGEACSSRPILGHSPLLLGQSESDDLDIPRLSEVQRQTAKAGANVEDTHAGREQQFCRNPLLFVRLCILQALFLAREVSARILQVVIEK